MYSYDKVLPIGTVVLLNNANKRLMIVGYQRKAAVDSEKIYDYCGCAYPEGFITPKEAAVFDHDQIDRIIFMGLQNGPQIAFAEKLKEVIARREGAE